MKPYARRPRAGTLFGWEQPPSILQQIHNELAVFLHVPAALAGTVVGPSLFTAQAAKPEETYEQSTDRRCHGGGLVGVLSVRRASGNGLQRQCLLDYQRKIH